MSECVYEGMREVVRGREIKRLLIYLLTLFYIDLFINSGEYSFIFYLSIHFYLLTSLFYFIYLFQGNKCDRQRARNGTEKNKNNK